MPTNLRRSTWPASGAPSTSGCSTATVIARTTLVGEWVLIHVGFALSRIDEREALATLELLEQMGADYEQELRELRASAIE